MVMVGLIFIRGFALSLLLALVLTSGVHSVTTDETVQQLTNGMAALKESVEMYKNILSIITRQVMNQQLYVEEQTRSSGQSGLKRARNYATGTRPYYSAGAVNDDILAMHSHANNIRTVGMGEFEAVLNGVEFRTRHNDYSLKMKSPTSSRYGVKEDIPFPPVPSDVTDKKTIPEQVQEMKEYFKAFKTSNITHRNYQPYFKPLLCYLEGAWTISDQNKIEESFDSDRHHLAASSWLELLEKVRFNSYTGAKDSGENIAYLPTSIIKMINDTFPLVAQWNFQILCHPLKTYVHPSYFRPVVDLKTRLKRTMTLEQYTDSRAARFTLATNEEGEFQETTLKHTLLDQMMKEIPGADNYLANITDDMFGSVAYPLDRKAQSPINAGYFHRGFRLKELDANGRNERRRGYSDESIFMSMNTQPKIANLDIKLCKKKICNTASRRMTYAVPLEVIFMTPLSQWNPYDIEYKGEFRKSPAKTVYEGPNGGKRTGKGTAADTAYNGTNSKTFYRTPYEMFENFVGRNTADTAENFVNVLNRAEKVCKVRATGHPVVLPILDIGRVRLRWPIVPIYSEGEATWKEMAALKDIVLNPSKYSSLLA